MSWWQNAKVGDRVVCVAPPAWRLTGDGKVNRIEPWLALGGVYTIEEVTTSWYRPNAVMFRVKGKLVSARCFRPAQPKSSESGVLALKKTAFLASLKLKVYALSEAG